MTHPSGTPPRLPPAGTQARRSGLWIGFLGGWTVSGVLVATGVVGGLGAVLAFVLAFGAIGGAVYERRVRMQHWVDQERVPSPWDGAGWEGWLVLAGRAMAAFVVIRILAAVPWSSQWTDILWRIRS